MLLLTQFSLGFYQLYCQFVWPKNYKQQNQIILQLVALYQHSYNMILCSFLRTPHPHPHLLSTTRSKIKCTHSDAKTSMHQKKWGGLHSPAAVGPHVRQQDENVEANLPMHEHADRWRRRWRLEELLLQNWTRKRKRRMRRGRSEMEPLSSSTRDYLLN